jgi:Antimicrobial peptide resistance and lipid A acylation protein PagP
MKKLRTAGVFCVALVALSVCAEEQATKIWINPGAQSYHLNRSQDYRENNTGLGAEFIVAPAHGFIAGSYINSNRARSQYGGYHWRALHYRPVDVNVSLGPVFALVNGYPDMRDGGWFPAIFPMLSLEYGRYGANFSFIPNPTNGSAVALQLKFLIW